MRKLLLLAVLVLPASPALSQQSLREFGLKSERAAADFDLTRKLSVLPEPMPYSVWFRLGQTDDVLLPYRQLEDGQAGQLHAKMTVLRIVDKDTTLLAPDLRSEIPSLVLRDHDNSELTEGERVYLIGTLRVGKIEEIGGFRYRVVRFAPVGEPRGWRIGRKTIKATLASQDEDSVTLQAPNGELATIKKSRLSTADRKFLQDSK